eukprot:scaffold38305_cov62-Cyclotella_meneghiniana.AAC.6
MARYNTFNTESMVRCNKNQCGCPSSHHDERRVGLQCGTWHVLRHIDSQTYILQQIKLLKGCSNHAALWIVGSSRSVVFELHYNPREG